MAESDPARARFYFISAHRVLGGIMVLLGLMVLSGTLDWDDAVGWVLLALGLADFFIAPLVFARLWRSPPP